jgi:hypothetical protein
VAAWSKVICPDSDLATQNSRPFKNSLPLTDIIPGAAEELSETELYIRLRFDDELKADLEARFLTDTRYGALKAKLGSTSWKKGDWSRVDRLCPMADTRKA